MKKSNKIRASITIDKNVWNLLKYRLPCSRSNFFEQQAIKYLNSSDQIAELQEKIKNNELETQQMKMELEKLISIKKENDKNKELIEKAMIVIRDINFQNNFISQDQLNFISQAHNISKEVIEAKCKDENITISNF